MALRYFAVIMIQNTLLYARRDEAAYTPYAYSYKLVDVVRLNASPTVYSAYHVQ